MVKMKTDDIEDLRTLLHIKIPDSKTNKTRSFTVVGENFIGVFRKYAALRPKEMNDRRFFVKYQNGKCQRSVMGIHKIGSVPKEVASYLKLPHWKEYTGHCLRRTSATLLVDAGADITCLKRHGGWRSSSVAEGYIEDSLANKKDIALKILSQKKEVEAEVAVAAAVAGSSTAGHGHGRGHIGIADCSSVTNESRRNAVLRSE